MSKKVKLIKMEEQLRVIERKSREATARAVQMREAVRKLIRMGHELTWEEEIEEITNLLDELEEKMRLAGIRLSDGEIKATEKLGRKF